MAVLDGKLPAKTFAGRNVTMVVYDNGEMKQIASVIQRLAAKPIKRQRPLQIRSSMLPPCF
ncbi:hypothetical protein [Noviherbaspirillum pedocola]|uniref:Uncharacterized protein n=1 Tax=Noviherbaspirillum pedocola TaxID=2801341 RepID=A0A934W8N9_9BURK|nr:hypothetical protein [Noviherbaspirillum pedocola]MBK4736044.1 hypothetical protein [Noviherbaspirillum pedocola]